MLQALHHLRRIFPGLVILQAFTCLALLALDRVTLAHTLTSKSEQGGDWDLSAARGAEAEAVSPAQVRREPRHRAHLLLLAALGHQTRAVPQRLRLQLLEARHGRGLQTPGIVIITINIIVIIFQSHLASTSPVQVEVKAATQPHTDSVSLEPRHLEIKLWRKNICM